MGDYYVRSFCVKCKKDLTGNLSHGCCPECGHRGIYGSVTEQVVFRWDGQRVKAPKKLDLCLTGALIIFVVVFFASYILDGV